MVMYKISNTVKWKMKRKNTALVLLLLLTFNFQFMVFFFFHFITLKIQITNKWNNGRWILIREGNVQIHVNVVDIKAYPPVSCT